MIIPAWNAGGTISEAISSAQNQTLPPFEIIVVDDRSTDNTAQVVQAFGSGVKLIQGTGEGSGPARNLGVAMASGDLIAFLDADDVWQPLKLEKQLPLTGRDVIVGCYAEYFVGDKSKIVGTSIRTQDDGKANQFVLLGKGMPLLLSSFVMPREDFLRFGGFDARYVRSQDYEFLVRVCMSGVQLRIVREAMLYYRLHTQSDTLLHYMDQYMTAEHVKDKYLRAETLELDEWKSQNFRNYKLLRKAKAGLHFRAGVVNLRTGHRIRGLAQIFVGMLNDPRKAIAKISTQSNFKSRRH